MSRRGAASIVASPVLVGAVTVLIVVVSVLLAYNANQGLPFVPTYELRAELPGGANLVPGNELRVGGFRVGLIDGIGTKTITREGEQRAIAVLDMKLDKTVEPLPTDTHVIVRPRSALGLKYVQLNPGEADTFFQPGDTIPLANAGQPVEFDDFLNTFDDELRADSQTALQGFGTAFAGRGQSLNTSLQELPEFFGSLTTVMDYLNDPETELDELFRQIGRTSAQVAPVADVQARLFTNMADTFAAISRDPRALQATLEEAVPTLDEGIQSFRVQRPFLTNFTDLSIRLRPAAQELPRSLPAINAALVEGQRVLPRAVALNQRTEDVLRALFELAQDPNLSLGLRDLRFAIAQLRATFKLVSPYASVCNYPVHFLNGLGEHISEQVDGGTTERIELAADNRQQNNRLSTSESSRPADVPAGVSPYDESAFPLGPPTRHHEQLRFGPVVDGSGRADCESGQKGYILGPFGDAPRYGPNEDGGRRTAGVKAYPGNSGPTFTGVPSLGQVDGGHPNSLRAAP